jgi:hypothetical protein
MRRNGWRMGTVGVAAVMAVALAGCNSDHSARQSAPQQQQQKAGTTGKQTGSGKQAAVSPLQAIRLAAAHVSKASTAHVAGRISMTDPGSGQRMTFRLVADEQWRPTLRMRLTMSGSGFSALSSGTTTIRELLTSKAVYLSFPQLRRQLGKDWVMMRLTDLTKASGVDISQLMDQARQFDPSQSLTMLGESGRIRKVGTGTVSGVPTTHYAGDVDIAAALRRLPATTSKTIRQGIARLGLRTEHVDAWIDGAGRLRRVVTTAHGSGMTMRTDMVVSRYGQRVSITPPPASDTVDLRDLLGRKA